MNRPRALAPSRLLSVLAVAGTAALFAVAGCSDRQARDRPSQGQPSAVAAIKSAPAHQAPLTAEQTALKERIASAMSGYESLVTRQELQRMGSPQDLTVALTAVYDDLSLPLVVRTNALASLHFFPSSDSKQVFERVLGRSDLKPVVRRSAIRAYGAGFRDEAVPVLERFLDHEDRLSREAAVRALGAAGSERARQALARRLPHEPEPSIRSSIEAGMSSGVKSQ